MGECGVLELYYFPTATCGYKARLTLDEKRVDFTARVLDRDAGDLLTPEYLRLNPNAVVPTLVHDGHVIIESSIIMAYIDHAFAGPALSPGDPLGRARMQMWMKQADERYLPSIGAVTYGTFRRMEILEQHGDHLEAYYSNIPDPDRRAQRRSVVEQGIRSPHARQGIVTLQQMLVDIEAAVSDQPYLCGAAYSLADASVTPFVSRLNELALDWMWADLPGVRGWWDRIRARASFDAVFGAFPNPDRIRRLREAGLEARSTVEEILSGAA